MKLFISTLMIVLAQAAAAQSVGIQFGDMPVGTQWTTELLESETRREETYLGREGDWHITELVGIQPSGERRIIFRNYYDLEGRLVRGERNGAANTKLPFSCRYLVGECTHFSSIPHDYVPSNTKFTQSRAQYINRIDGSVFYFGTVLSDGSVQEYPFELGKYNIRVGQRYENNFGEERGFRLIDMREP